MPQGYVQLGYWGMPIANRNDLMPFPFDILSLYAARAYQNHGKDLEELAAGGGLSLSELLAIIEDREWKPVPDIEAIERLSLAITLYHAEPIGSA